MIKIEPIGAEKALVIEQPNQKWFSGKMKDYITIDLGTIDGKVERSFRFTFGEYKLTDTGASCSCTAPTFKEDPFSNESQIIDLVYKPKEKGKRTNTIYLYSNGNKQIVKLESNAI